MPAHEKNTVQAWARKCGKGLALTYSVIVDGNLPWKGLLVEYASSTISSLEKSALEHVMPLLRLVLEHLGKRVSSTRLSNR